MKIHNNFGIYTKSSTKLFKTMRVDFSKILSSSLEGIRQASVSALLEMMAILDEDLDRITIEILSI